MMTTTDCCGGTGWYKKDVPFGHPDFGKLFRCECGKAGSEERMARFHDHLKAYQHCTFESWNAERSFGQAVEWGGVTYPPTDQQKALAIATRRAWGYANNPQGMLFIFGGFGAGKTHLAVAIAQHVASTKRVEYYSAPDLFDKLRSAAGRFGVEDMLAPILSADLLVLDDIGADDVASSFIQGRLFRIIDERLHLPTIITSNLDLPSLEEKIGGRLQSRLHQSTKIWLPIADYRKERR